MQSNVRVRWLPASQPGLWHFFSISEFPLPSKKAIGSETRVAYLTFTNDGPVATTPELWEEAKEKAKWNLAPAEVRALDNLELKEDGGTGPTAAWLASHP